MTNNKLVFSTKFNKALEEIFSYYTVKLCSFKLSKYIDASELSSTAKRFIDRYTFALHNISLDLSLNHRYRQLGIQVS